MKFSVFLVVTFCLASITSVKSATSKISSRLKHVDIDTVLRSERLLNVYLRCLLENVKCTAEGAELRRVMPYLLENECVECTEDQKTAGVKLVKFVAKEKPEAWEKLIAIYDPKKIFRTKWAKQIEEEGIAVK